MAKNGVDGVYNKDPRKHKDAVKYDKLTHQTLINDNLQVIDLTAASMASENNIDLVIFDIEKEGNFKKAVLKEEIGTIIKEIMSEQTDLILMELEEKMEKSVDDCC